MEVLYVGMTQLLSSLAMNEHVQQCRVSLDVHPKRI